MLGGHTIPPGQGGGEVVRVRPWPLHFVCGLVHELLGSVTTEGGRGVGRDTGYAMCQGLLMTSGWEAQPRDKLIVGL